MPTPVLMPQMGESIAEGTIVRWIKRLGDSVERDEPLFEISTDKVDTEIPSPAAGVLAEVRFREGETVAVNTVVAMIAKPGETAAAPPKPPTESKGPAAAPAAKESKVSQEDVSRQRSSPLVRKIAREHNVDISQIQGSGLGGRVTKHDILNYVQAGPGERPGAPAPTLEMPAFRPGEAVEIAPMSPMRKRIAEHMLLSRRTSAHVHSVFEINFTRIAQIREAKRAEYERAGTKLTYLAFITKAAANALRAMPMINASIDGDRVIYKKDINIGIAVALDWGLIVPVIRRADEESVVGLSRTIADLAGRARGKQLSPDDVQGGTFTITNPGVFGALFGMPIINQPQVAILGVGAVEKRPVVVDDAIAIRPMAYLSLGYDHRLIDGAVADQFMSRIKSELENFDPAGL